MHKMTPRAHRIQASHWHQQWLVHWLTCDFKLATTTMRGTSEAFSHCRRNSALARKRGRACPAEEDGMKFCACKSPMTACKVATKSSFRGICVINPSDVSRLNCSSVRTLFWCNASNQANATNMQNHNKKFFSALHCNLTCAKFKLQIH